MTGMTRLNGDLISYEFSQSGTNSFEIRPSRIMLPHRSIVALILSFVLSPIFTGCGKPTSTDPRVTKQDKRWNLPERLLKLRRLVDEARVTTIQGVADYLPKSTGQIVDLGSHVTDLLADLPGVIEVTDSKVDIPTQRIIHLIDHPLPTIDEFLICLRKMADGGIDRNQLASLYEDYLLQIELVQLEQMAVLRCLIKHHGLRRVFAEGLTPTNLPLFQAKVGALRDSGDDDAEANSQKEEQRRSKQIGQRRLDLLEIGAAGKLLMLGEIQNVLPLDGPDVIGEPTRDLDLVSTIGNQSHVHRKIHQHKTEVELDDRVRTVLTQGVFGLIVGDAHDLTENVHRISGGKCEYIRIKTKWSQEISPLDPNVWGR